MVKENKDRFEIGEIATQTGLAPIDTETNKPLSELELLVKIANDVEQIKKNIVTVN